MVSQNPDPSEPFGEDSMKGAMAAASLFFEEEHLFSQCPDIPLGVGFMAAIERIGAPAAAVCVALSSTILALGLIANPVLAIGAVFPIAALIPRSGSQKRKSDTLNRWLCENALGGVFTGIGSPACRGRPLALWEARFAARTLVSLPPESIPAVVDALFKEVLSIGDSEGSVRTLASFLCGDESFETRPAMRVNAPCRLPPLAARAVLAKADDKASASFLMTALSNDRPCDKPGCQAALESWFSFARDHRPGWDLLWQRADSMTRESAELFALAASFHPQTVCRLFSQSPPSPPQSPAVAAILGIVLSTAAKASLESSVEKPFPLAVEAASI